jgi:hypothetical protein
MGNARIIRPPLGLTCWCGQTSDVRTCRNASTFSQGTCLGKIGVRVSDLPGKIGRARKHTLEAGREITGGCDTALDLRALRSVSSNQRNSGRARMAGTSRDRPGDDTSYCLQRRLSCPALAGHPRAPSEWRSLLNSRVFPHSAGPTILAVGIAHELSGALAGRPEKWMKGS